MSNGTIRRGEIVVVDFTPTNPRARVRPALVEQNDRDNARMTKTIVAHFTSNTSRAAEDTQLLINPLHSDWDRSGLRLASVITCTNLVTVEQQDIMHVIGALSTSTMSEIDACLKAALGIA